MHAATTERRPDVDWLRVFAVLLLIPFHAARVFDVYEPFYAKSPDTSWQLSYLITFLNVWQMPLLFVLAGASTWFALQRRGGGAYVAERFKRLGVPLVFGVVVIVPLQAYLACFTIGRDPGSLPTFLSTYFQVDPNDMSGYYGTFTPGHIWFILFLLIISLVALPLLLMLRGQKREGVGRLFSAPGALLTWFIPLWVLAGLPDAGGKNLFVDLALFVFGYLLFGSPRLQQAIDRNVWLASAAAVVAIGGVIASTALRLDPPRFTAADVGLSAVRYLAMWASVLALLGLGKRYLRTSSSLLTYASQASYPFYLWHQTVLVAIGFWVVRWSVGIPLEYAAIVLLSLVTTLAVYEFGVRRWNVMRFLCGMHPLPARISALPPRWSGRVSTAPAAER